MKQVLGHTDLGIFAVVAHGGMISTDDGFSVLP
jgi:hypothetical protein